MVKQVFYKYLGTNGVIESPVHLEDVYYVRIMALTADKNKILTNGEKKLKFVKIPEEELEKWSEIDE